MYAPHHRDQGYTGNIIFARPCVGRKFSKSIYLPEERKTGIVLFQAPLGCESGTLGCLDFYSPACGRPGLCAEGTPAEAIGGGDTAVVGRAEECQEECDLSEDCLFYSYELGTGLC